MSRYFVIYINKIRSCLGIFLTTLGIRVLIICFLILLTVGQLSKDVLDKENYLLDESFLLWLEQWSNPKLDQIMLMITQLGDFNIVIIVITITLSILLQKSYYQEAKFFLVACLGHPILADGMKLLYGKPRPKFCFGLIWWKQVHLVFRVDLAWGHEYLKALPDDEKSQTW